MAAAYAALVSLFNNLELIQTHPRHSFSFENKQIQSLLEIVCLLIDFMETGDYHGGSKEAAEVLERRIASAAHAAEDVVESHVVDQIRAGSTLDGKKRSRFLLDVQKVTEDMEFVRRKAIKVKKAHSGFKAEQPTFSAAATSSTPPSSDKDKMVGFDDKLLQLLDLLTDYPSSRRVIPIVGTGGIGKTTLAKNAFQHKFIVEHFDVCLWVTISQQYVVSDILSKLLSGCGESRTKTVDELGVQLRKRLYGRRYLIVLDDMWNVEAWDEIKFFFPDTSSGSRIIVTSRQSDVADHFDSESLAMSFLKKEESWDLFCEKAFAEQGCPPELEDIGRKIVEKCGGLPLALVVVGSHLGMSPWTQEYWGNVGNHMSSMLNSGENDEQLFDILYLSYSHLPVHLKPCFLYVGVFPEDKDISASFLIRLWIAEGFLKPKQGKTLEEVGEGCLHDLIARNLILVNGTSSMRKIRTCAIHDVLRDLCLRLVEKENFFGVLDASRSMSMDRERRVVMSKEEKDFWGYEFVNSRFLEYGIKKKRVFNIDSSISLLWNLQTLIVKGYTRTFAPYEIWEMTQLRHLICDSVNLPDPLPNDEANDMVLRNLQTLDDVVNLRLSDEVCKRIPNIKELRMKYSNSKDEAWWSFCPHNLGRLHKLESLHCSMYLDGLEWPEFAQALTFPSSLKELVLSWVRLDWEEITMKIGSLPLLEVLQLDGVKGAEWNPVEGGFPRLRSLDIRWCYDLTNWNAERWHFPVLEHLSLIYLSNLDELPYGIGEIATLERIFLKNCSVGLGISGVKIVVEQEDYGNHGLQLHVSIWDEEEKEMFKKIVEEEGLTTNNLHLSSYS